MKNNSLWLGEFKSKFSSALILKTLIFIVSLVSCRGQENLLALGCRAPKVIDACGVCGGDSTTCVDCAGQPYGKTVIDACGVCGGDNTSCLDCAGVLHGGKQIDACGVCGGDNTYCADCGGSL
ncbi:MAG: hypothetical protein QGI45_07710, partial [Myxococcota bacterium]|nr:hypothetical protein [Myxococcota bacterium]